MSTNFKKFRKNAEYIKEFRDYNTREYKDLIYLCNAGGFCNVNINKIL